MGKGFTSASASGITIVRFRELYGVPRFESMWALCKARSLSTVLLLQALWFCYDLATSGGAQGLFLLRVWGLVLMVLRGL